MGIKTKVVTLLDRVFGIQATTREGAEPAFPALGAWQGAVDPSEQGFLARIFCCDEISEGFSELVGGSAFQKKVRRPGDDPSCHECQIWIPSKNHGFRPRTTLGQHLYDC